MLAWIVPPHQLKLMKRAAIKVGKAPVVESQLHFPTKNSRSVFERLGPRVSSAGKSYQGQRSGVRSFFITNFPKGCNSDRLHSALKHQGAIKDLTIARKLSNRGRQFGFVDFDGVEDVDLLMFKLNNTWMGSYRLQANLARFPKHNSKFKPTSSAAPLNLALQPSVPTLNDGSSSTTKTISTEYLCLSSATEPNSWLSRSFQASLKQLNSFRDLQRALKSAGYLNIVVSPFGPGKVLFWEEEPLDLCNLIGKDKDWLSNWADNISTWTPQDPATTRWCRIKIYGLPLHAWSKYNLSVIGNQIGTLICIDELTLAKLDLEAINLTVQVPLGATVDQILQVKVDGRLFSLQVVEYVKADTQWYEDLAPFSDSESMLSAHLSADTYEVCSDIAKVANKNSPKVSSDPASLLLDEFKLSLGSGSLGFLLS